MRIVVFSDSHNNYAPLKNILQTHMDAECFIHLGDGERDWETLTGEFPDKKILIVRGNCDWCSEQPREDIIECGGKRIFYTHGQYYGVKDGLSKLMQRAKEMSADIVLFGHTHQAFDTYELGMHIMNPGSVAQPRDSEPSYGIIDVTPAGITTRIVRTG